MRVAIVLVTALGLIVAESSFANVPLAAVGHSEDNWERPRKERADCNVVEEQRVFGIENRRASDAVRRLQRRSVVALTDNESGNLLGIDLQSPYATLAEQLLATRIQQLIERRRLAFEERRGGWSGMDQHNLDGLRALNAGSLSPFLVRALAAAKEHIGRVEVYVCADGLLTTTYPTAGTRSRGRPDRVGLVVLLESTPVQSVAEWTYDDPTLNH